MPINGDSSAYGRRTFRISVLAQLAHLYYEQRAGLSQLLECENVKQVRELLATQVTHYWETHYVFGEKSAKSEKKLSAASLNLQIINTVAPILFAYGKHKNSEKYCERAFDFLETLKQRRITSLECGRKWG